MGTICALDLKTLKLFHVFGNRDTWGGYPRIPWMRNEWHGPARGCAAISDDQLFWATGSRIIAIRGGGKAGEVSRPEPEVLESPQGAQQKGSGEATEKLREREDFERYVWQVSSVSGVEEAAVSALGAELDKAVRELVKEGPFAPLYVNFGIGGRDLFFTSPADDIEALATAYPHLREETRAEARRYVDRLLGNRDLFGDSALYDFRTGPRREYHPVPLSDQPGYWGAGPKRPAFGGCYALWRWAEATGDRRVLEKFWQRMRSAFSEARPLVAKLNLDRGERYGNLYINALIGYARAARVLGHEADAQAAAKMAGDQLRRLTAAARKGAEDPEESIFCPIRSHYQCMGRFGYLSPEIGRAYAENVGDSLKKYISFIDLTTPGWFIVNNEHQIHFGENYTDGPDLAEAIFSLRVYAGCVDAKLVDQWIDIPWCKGDLSTIKKLALAMEFAGKRSWRDFTAGGARPGK